MGAGAGNISISGTGTRGNYRMNFSDSVSIVTDSVAMATTKYGV